MTSLFFTNNKPPSHCINFWRTIFWTLPKKMLHAQKTINFYLLKIPWYSRISFRLSIFVISWISCAFWINTAHSSSEHSDLAWRFSKISFKSEPSLWPDFGRHSILKNNLYHSPNIFTLWIFIFYFQIFSFLYWNTNGVSDTIGGLSRLRASSLIPFRQNLTTK